MGPNTNQEQESIDLARCRRQIIGKCYNQCRGYPASSEGDRDHHDLSHHGGGGLPREFGRPMAEILCSSPYVVESLRRTGESFFFLISRLKTDLG